jgi:hypothetical protein
MAMLEKAWRARTITWLAEVRRAGKTVPCHPLPEIEYFDCELPHVRRLMEDPDSFLDEIHRLDDAARLLKIASEED